VLPGSRQNWVRAVRRGYSRDVIAAKLEAAGFVVDDITPFYAICHLAQEVRDRWIRGRRPTVQLAAFPFLVGAVHLELLGLRCGRNRAILVTAHRPHDEGTQAPPP
jgi:hypothetical protein